MPTQREHWESVWSSKAPDAVSWHQAQAPFWSDLVRRVSAPDSRVAVAGAGVSALLLDLVERGYDNLDAIDLSQAALDQLRDGLGEHAARVRFVRADVRDVRLDGPVDVWGDRATFHFLTDLADRQAYADRLCEAVRVGGHAIIATFSETGPEQCSGLPVSRYSAQSLHAEFARCFDLVDSWTLDHLTPWGTPQSFTYVLLQRADQEWRNGPEHRSFAFVSRNPSNGRKAGT